ncbi:MAG TPA: hypothetical protein PLN56_01660 [Methanoregulaceae archaeon]|nr:MAG: hypothetical protein IPI71_00690 [Methanolinea sp.]HON80955.1 hypothetical protein [Methanoregulaceae archaeon]HPD09694.1 hypothetical protein [Methanoregulaceae archaeon]HRT15727.1 hypothetical protein [Methanoregulaceae archaeon]HRU31193.1 hypothetical protein [Methanoregulaceae archaeon]
MELPGIPMPGALDTTKFAVTGLAESLRATVRGDGPGTPLPTDTPVSRPRSTGDGPGMEFFFHEGPRLCRSPLAPRGAFVNERVAQQGRSHCWLPKGSTNPLWKKCVNGDLVAGEMSGVPCPG